MTAIKSYLGHSLAAAGGDQMISTLGGWKNNIIPGITSTPELAENVHKENVRFLLKNKKIENDEFNFAVLNAKGFGGNNGTSLVASPSQTMKMLESKYSKSDIKKYIIKKSKIDDQLNDSKKEILQGEILTAKNITLKRTSNLSSIKQLELVLGKTAKNLIKKNQPVLTKDIN